MAETHRVKSPSMGVRAKLNEFAKIEHLFAEFAPTRHFSLSQFC
jgi:hypothetical protein